MKKIICIFMALVMTLCAFTACGKKEDAASDLAASASELKANCEELTTYIDAGLEQGYLTDEDKDLFNSYVTRLDEIINGEGEPADAEELENLKGDLAVMASKCAAPDDVVDLFVGGNKTEEETENTDNSDNSDNNAEENAASDEENTPAKDAPENNAADTPKESSENSEPAPKLSHDFNALINDYLDLQNETSQKVDKGEVEMDDYTRLLEVGTDLATLKEEAEANGETDDISKRADELKKTVYDLAKKMNSDLADKFK